MSIAFDRDDRDEKPKPAHDLEALIHAQNCILARNTIFPHVLDRRALAELDRLIAEARR